MDETMEHNVLSTCHPANAFLFFAAVIIFGMCFLHPAFLFCSAGIAAIFLFMVRGRKALRMAGIIMLMFAVIAFVNPFFNQNGSHVLFTYANGRIYSLESVLYGMALGGIFVTVLFWFACYSVIMTSDKFLYLFGGMLPSVSLILTMVLRLVPLFKKKADQISGARKCIGKAGALSGRKEMISNGGAILSALAGWALEGGVITADSMQSRGYGSGKRTTFSIYRFDRRDKILMLVWVALIAIVAWCGWHDGMKVSFVPEMNIPAFGNRYTVTGIIAYVVLMAFPVVWNLVEAIRWHSLRSAI